MQPNATALRLLGRSTTWAELGASDRTRRRVEPAWGRFGDRVLILMLNRQEFVESFLAVNRLGAIAVPVNFRLTPPEIAFLVARLRSAGGYHRAGARRGCHGGP